MTRINLIIIFAILYQQANGQFNFTNDTTFNPFYLDAQIDSIFSLKKNNDFEFRFMKHPSSLIASRRISLFVMTYNNGRWEARLFHHTYFPVDKYWEQHIDSINLSNLWVQLERQNILNIPKAHLLKDKRGEIAGSRVMDGTSFWFEFITEKSKRSYMYISPKVSAEDFPKIKEFKQVSNIIEIISKYCHL